jgi:hypothetical protein
MQRHWIAAGALLLCRWCGSNGPFGPDSGLLQAGPTFAMVRGRWLNSTDAALRSLEQRAAAAAARYAARPTTQVVLEAHRNVWIDAVRASPRISF